MKIYPLPEASLPFPGEGWLDNSMNVFRHAGFRYCDPWKMRAEPEPG